MREGKTRPGQSHNLTVGARKIVWKCFVWPGVFDTLTTCRQKAQLHLHHSIHSLASSLIGNNSIFT